MSVSLVSSAVDLPQFDLVPPSTQASTPRRSKGPSDLQNAAAALAIQQQFLHQKQQHYLQVYQNHTQQSQSQSQSLQQVLPSEKSSTSQSTFHTKKSLPKLPDLESKPQPPLLPQLSFPTITLDESNPQDTLQTTESESMYSDDNSMVQTHISNNDHPVTDHHTRPRLHTLDARHRNDFYGRRPSPLSQIFQTLESNTSLSPSNSNSTQSTRINSSLPPTPSMSSATTVSRPSSIVSGDDSGTNFSDDLSVTGPTFEEKHTGKSKIQSRLRKTLSMGPSANIEAFQYSHSNASTDNASITSTASSASVMIRKLGNVGKFAKRASAIGLTLLFKDGKKSSTKADVVTGSVSHVTVESESSALAPSLSAINTFSGDENFTTSTLASVASIVRTSSHEGTKINTHVDTKNIGSITKFQLSPSENTSAHRKRFSFVDFSFSKISGNQNRERGASEDVGSKSPRGSRKGSNTLSLSSVVKSPQSVNAGELKGILKNSPKKNEHSRRSSGHHQQEYANSNARYMNSNIRADLRTEYNDHEERFVRGGPSSFVSDTKVEKVLSQKRSLSFSQSILIHDTWPSWDYDRRGELATCHRLTPVLAQTIKQELNSYKLEEMEVHHESRAFTHFFT